MTKEINPVKSLQGEASKGLSNRVKQKSADKKTKITGIVVSDKMDKTIVIEVGYFKKHPRYLKVFKVSKKIKIHDKKNEAKMGDLVEAIASRPISRDKSFILVKIIKSKI